MEVLQKRQGPKPWSIKVRCTHCSSKLKIEAEDIYQASDDRSEHWAAITCPQCEQQTEIPQRRLPEGFHYADRQSALERAWAAKV